MDIYTVTNLIYIIMLSFQQIREFEKNEQKNYVLFFASLGKHK